MCLCFPGSARNVQGWGKISAIEMGPDQVLKHLMKNNTPAIRIYSMGNNQDLETIKERSQDNDEK